MIEKVGEEAKAVNLNPEPLAEKIHTSIPNQLSPMTLVISTKTKVLFLNQPIDIHRIFWEIPILKYWIPKEGILKKQIKIVSKTMEEYESYIQKRDHLDFYHEQIIKQIHNPNSRSIKFKDERKLTIGASKKDVLLRASKTKNAFYNCLAVVMRFQEKEEPHHFREVHIKIFNTGKMEIPGIIDYRIMNQVKQMILDLLNLYAPPPSAAAAAIGFIENSQSDHVLINSNFNCGYCIHREKLYSILIHKYKIECSYDPCTYPGIKCKYYFNNELGLSSGDMQTGLIWKEDQHMKMSELISNKKYTEVSIMIFRTGSCLIVGNCSEKILRFIFEFIKNILIQEYSEIHIPLTDAVLNSFYKKKPKSKKRIQVVIDPLEMRSPDSLVVPDIVSEG